MKTYRKIFTRTLLALIAAAGATSCAEDLLDNPADANRVLLPGEYRFIISRDNPYGSTSRVSQESLISSRFETGDEIGVFASNSDKQIQNDVFAARSLNDDSEIQVLAPPTGKVTQGLDTEIPTGANIKYLFYYPMNKDLAKSDILGRYGYMFSVETDQSTKEGYEKSDFLWNYLASDPTEPYQMISMHHLMANIVVKVHRDSIDRDRGVTLRSMPVAASRIFFESKEPGAMDYLTATQTRKDIKMFYQGASGEYLIYRAAVPAYHQVPSGQDIITCTLYNRAGDTEEVTYKLNKDLYLLDGHYYTFTLQSGVKAAVPDITDDDSWVLDVFDPETNEIVGLMCREYIRYQPQHSTTETNLLIDAPTGYYEGAYDKDTSYPINGYAVSSQAYVFYNLFEPNIDNIPNLETGTIVRVLYDIVATRDGAMQGDPAYPYPHRRGGVAVGDGGANMAQGIFMPRHGHRWVFDESLGYARSSDDWTENWLHGAQIHWAAATGLKYTASNSTDPEDMTYYRIDNLIPSEEHITNEVAYNYGHVAIPESGQPFVSYTPFDEDAIRDYDGNKIAYIVPHYLTDTRSDVVIDYPIVKIGFNNFWMSQSLRSTTMTNGTKLTCCNSDDESNQFVNFTLTHNQSWGNWNVQQPSYLHPRYNSSNSGIPSIDFSKIDTQHPLLYNYTAIKDPNFVPVSPDNRFNTMLPDIEKFQKIMNYFGWSFAAKLMTSNSWIFIENGGVEDHHSDAVETKYEALLKQKTVTNKFLPANVSGFNIKTTGNFNTEFLWYGGTAGLWIDNSEKDQLIGRQLSVLSLDMPNAWDANKFYSVFLHLAGTQYEEGVSTVYKDCLRSQIFYPVRFIMQMRHQLDTSDPSDVTRSLVNSISRSGKAPKTSAKHESRIVNVPVVK